jgi:Zn-dependent peptidase ImmA (M78 family)
MGVKGIRKRNIGEPTLIKDVKDVIDKASNDGFINGYCVDIESIIRNEKNLELVRDNNMESSISGSLSMDNQLRKWVIKVNSKHHIKRQRYTMAHEYAHYKLHKDDLGKFVDEEIYFRNRNKNAIEYNADRFASELLMPEKLFIEAVKIKNIREVEKLADMFQVSSIAIEIRAKTIKEKNTK